VPRRVLLDSGTQPLMLEASAITGLELTKDTLKECPSGLSYMTDGGENLSYNDVTDGRTVGHVH
jgi:hypothetical protein